MADNLDDGEFWLPPKFLNDDDTSFNLQNVTVSRAMFPYLISPVDSSETESDEEEQQLAELTRQMARSSLGLDLSNRHSSAAEKPKVFNQSLVLHCLILILIFDIFFFF